MATVVPAPRESNVIEFALQLVGLAQSGKESKARKALAEKKFDLEKGVAETNKKYLEAQSERMLGVERREKEVHEVEKQLGILASQGMKDRVEYELLSHQLDYLKNLNEDETKLHYGQKNIIDALRADIQARGAALESAKFGQQQLEFTLETQMRQAQSVQKQFEDSYRPSLNAFAGTPMYPSVDEAAKAHFRTMNNPKASPEERKSSEDNWQKALLEASKQQNAFDLEQLKIKEKLGAETSLDIFKGKELAANQEHFINKEEWTRYLSNQNAEIELVESGLFSWIPGLGRARLRVKGSNTKLPDDARLVPSGTKEAIFREELRILSEQTTPPPYKGKKE